MLELLTLNSHNVKKIVVASSRAIYGEGKYFSSTHGFVYPESRDEAKMLAGDFNVYWKNDHEPLELHATDEQAKIHPTSVYGITKQNQEQMVMTVCPAIKIAPVALRYQNVYGPGQSLKNPYTGILSIFSTQIKNNQSINIFEDGLESRDFVFVDDVVEATIAGILNENANGQVFNVGTGIPTTVMDVALALLSNYQANIPLNVTGNFRIGDIRHNYANIDKIKKYLDFVPQIDFNQGIKKFTEWVNQQTIAQSKYQDSINELKEKGLMK